MTGFYILAAIASALGVVHHAQGGDKRWLVVCLVILFITIMKAIK